MKQVGKNEMPNMTVSPKKYVCLIHTEQAFIIFVIREHRGRLRNLIIKQISIFSQVNRKATVARILKKT